MSQPVDKGHRAVMIFALVVTAITSAFVMWMRWLETEILAAPDWCARAINAEKLSETRTASSFETCKDLLLAQIKAVSTNSHIDAGVIALCLLVLMVIVIAQGKVSFTASKTGVSGNIGKDEVQAAQFIADKAQDGVAEVKKAVNPAGEEL